MHMNTRLQALLEGLGILDKLAIDEAAIKKLIEAGAIDAILEAIRRHPDNEKVRTIVCASQWLVQPLLKRFRLSQVIKAAVALLNTLLQRQSAINVASYFYLIPALVAVTSWIIFGDGLRWTTWVGILLASFGVWLATRPRA